MLHPFIPGVTKLHRNIPISIFFGKNEDLGQNKRPKPLGSRKVFKVVTPLQLRFVSLVKRYAALFGGCLEGQNRVSRTLFHPEIAIAYEFLRNSEF